MFVFNLKINKNSFLKTFIIICTIICIILMIIGIYKIYIISKEYNQDVCLPKKEIVCLNEKNFTNVLKMVNDDLDTYVGQKISYTGYVYRVSDIKEDEFIIARDMIISHSPKQTVVVRIFVQF
jgi:hypothetical protein